MLSGGCRCIKGTTECLDFMFLILNKLNFGCRSHLLPYYYYFYFYYFYSFPLDSVKYYSQQFYHAVELILKWIYVKKLNILNSSSNPSPSEVLMLLLQGVEWTEPAEQMKVLNIRNIQLQIAQQGCDTPSWNLGTKWDLKPLQAD